jgi:hypothetical protein
MIMDLEYIDIVRDKKNKTEEDVMEGYDKDYKKMYLIERVKSLQNELSFLQMRFPQAQMELQQAREELDAFLKESEEISNKE